MKTFIIHGIDNNIDYCGPHFHKTLGVIQAENKQIAFEYARKNIKGFTSGYDKSYWSVDKHSDGAYLEEIEMIVVPETLNKKEG